MTRPEPIFRKLRTIDSGSCQKNWKTEKLKLNPGSRYLESRTKKVSLEFDGRNGVRNPSYALFPCRQKARIPGHSRMLYHGGASLQKRGLSAGQELQSALMTFASIGGADYYAWISTSLPQQVGTLPAYYAGSIYPEGFRETHKGRIQHCGDCGREKEVNN